jgi:uncharacterized membrane protein YhaH (DUF805 family)
MFKSPFSFNGRIRRTEYGITFIIYLIFYVFGTAVSESGDAGAIIFLVILIPVLWFLWAQGAKRCHDIGKSGWFQIIPFYFFVLLFREGHQARNEYGSNPKYPDQTIDLLDSETLDGHLKS